MAQIFKEGEIKVRPDVYYRYSNKGKNDSVGAVDGISALVMQAPWGPIHEVKAFTKVSDIKETYGECDGSKMAEAMFEEGASTVYAYRTGGTGGAKGTLTQGENVVITAKYEGDFPIKVKVQKQPGDETKQCFVIVDGAVKESFFFDAVGEEEAAVLADVLQSSAYITMEGGKTGAVAEFEQALTGGSDPSVTGDGYVEGFYALEPYYYNVICCDTIAEGIQNLLHEYIDEAVKVGKFPIGVVGGDTTAAFNERKNKAAGFNDEQIAFIGNAYADPDGNAVPSIMAVARLAGAIAATPSNKSIVHRAIKGAIDVPEKFTNIQYEEAILSGMILFSKSSDGQIWFDSGVTTLVAPDETQDAGWKKLKRTKVRNELMHRLDVIMERLIGKVNCDDNGIADVLQAGMGLLKDMAREKKILDGATFTLDGENPKTSDSAWFIVEADDIDSLEKIYLHYRFSNMPTA